MSYWNPSAFGRWSPFQRQPFPAPEVRDSDYHYITERDILDDPAAFQPDYYGQMGRGRRDDEDEPDVLLLKHRGTVYPLQFPAFSIGENLRVDTVRRAAAEATKTRDPKKIRLIYKGRELKDDGANTRVEGLKQKSELTCVVSESSVNGPLDSSDESATEEDMRKYSYDSDGRSGKRKSGKKDKKGRAGGNSYGEGSSRPNNTSSSNLAPTSTPSARRPSSSPGPRPFDPSLPAAATPRQGPGSVALNRLAELERKYRSEVAGPVEKLLSNPPSDPKARDYEVLRLSETIERELILKGTDAVETEGREDVRNKRRELVKELQGVLTRLDAARKRWKAES